MGLSHFSFDGERKVCKRKPAARHSRGGPPRCASRASACGSRTVGCPEFIRGIQFRPLGRNSLTTFRGQTALRGCPRPRLAALTRREKALYCPFLKEGVRNVARNKVRQLPPALGARSCSLFSSFKKGKAFSLRCLSPLCSAAAWVGRRSNSAGWDVASLPGCFAGKKADRFSKSRWPLARAGGPVARRRPVSANRQETTPDRRAVAPVVPRR